MKNYDLGMFLLRLAVAEVFVVAGLAKLLDPSGVAGLLGVLGFPLPVFWAWVLLLSEIIFGLAVLIGYKLKYVVWPLVLILFIAIALVHLPPLLEGKPMAYGAVTLHLFLLLTLVSLYFLDIHKQELA